MVDNKECLTVLDFVGQANKKLRPALLEQASVNIASYRYSKELIKSFKQKPLWGKDLEDPEKLKGSMIKKRLRYDCFCHSDWLLCMNFMLNSSKGVSSIVLGKWLGKACSQQSDKFLTS